MGKYERKISTILKEGASVGVYVIATALNVGSSGISSRMASYFQKVICLHLQEKYDYMQNLHYNGEIIIPKGNMPGRGVVIIDDTMLEFQTALCFGEINDARRIEKIKESLIEKDGVLMTGKDIDNLVSDIEEEMKEIIALKEE